MDYEYRKPQFLTIALFAGVFTGFVTTLANLIYDFIYRGITQYDFSEIINVSSIIIFTMVLLTLAGIIYYFVAKYVRRGDILFSVLYIIITIVLGMLLLKAEYSAPLSGGFKWLSFGETVITGLASALAVPYFAKHHDFFL